MNRIIVLALVASGFIAVPAFAQAQAVVPTQATEGVSYQSLSDKAAGDYRIARGACDAQGGYAKKVCLETAKVENARAIADAVAQFHNTPADLANARKEVANAEFDLGKAKCGDRNGRDKTTCLADAANIHNAALADASAGTPDGTMAANPAVMSNLSGTSGTAVADCDALTSTQKAACLSRRGGNVAKTAIDDTVITTKIKADLVKDPDLKAMDVHVETVKGVVMLSGFVPSQADIARAEELARATTGVSDVRNALTVKQP
jgi:hypothetical protein